MIHFPCQLRSSIEKTASVFPARSLSRFYYKEESVNQELSIAERFVSYLDYCPHISSLRKLHARIFTLGLGNSIFLGSKLLNCYASFDCLTESRWVFDRIINRNLSLWNSILVGYFRTDHFDEVLRLYLKLKRQNIGLDSSALTFSLKTCTELRTIEVGRGIHVDAFKFGLSRDRFVGSSLIGLYFKYGDIKDARAVFEEISERDVVVYTAMITGYAQIADCRAYEAFRIFCDMQEEGLTPNRVTLVSLLQAAAQLGALEEGRSVHGHAIRRGIDSTDEVMETSFVGMYIKCGAPDMATSIFYRMKERTIASWNALISGHVQMGQPLEALNLLCLMVQENLTPDLITLANGLLSCADLKCLHKGKSIHCYIIRRGIHLDLVSTTALVDMYSRCNSINQARELFDNTETMDVILFNVMIAGYLQSGSAYKAIETFREMVKAGIRLNLATILSILSASADLTYIRKGSSIHGYILRHGLQQNIETNNQILYMYAKCGRIDIARQVFSRMKDRDLVSWTSMMTSCVHHGHAGEAISILRLMQVEKLNPDSVTLLSLLQAFSQLGSLKLVKEVHGYAYRGHLDRDRTIINSLVTTYAKCGRLDMAKYLFESRSERCVTLWNTMIAAYGMHGNCEQALELFDQMQKGKVVPDEVTFTSILSGCSHAGLVEEGRHVFYSMTSEYLITPREEHYGCMVDLLGRAGHLEEAYDLVKCLPSRKSASALSALLAACRVHRNLEMGEAIGKQLMNLEPENSGTHTLLSNIYAEAGQWDEVVRIRAIVKERGLRKMAGYSLIELDEHMRGI
ncbi:pentatricopeptide repeat-containing protein At4g21300-like [Telopea speciosissima]|uniref:pentatricopeptide repeat-containing protein At4g21300-like n=1 Tax=Telopea speciosissima TaxID=54955 RepID=UPI001CC64F5C|nr:pentatricopeptide repeat-containing protein At4g21300-like [Telopea speciosissima]